MVSECLAKPSIPLLKPPIKSINKKKSLTFDKILTVCMVIFLSYATLGEKGTLVFLAVAGYCIAQTLPTPKTQKHIRLFEGNAYRGVSYESYNALKTTFQSQCASTVLSCSSLKMDPSTWGPQDIFVLPGGKCSDWELTPATQKQILRWVENGGMILGKCAGGYFCSEKSEYLISESSSLFRIRDLALFPGTCKGPAYSHQIKIVRIRWEKTKKEGHVVVIGGGVFIPHKNPRDSHFEVLARFIDEPHNEAIAVVKCFNKKGIAILSSPHWEFDEKDLIGLSKIKNFEDQAIDKYLPLLQESRGFRQECIQSMLKEFEL